MRSCVRYCRGVPTSSAELLTAAPAADAATAGTGTARYSAASELLRALAAPVRLAIVAELEPGPRCVHELVTALHVSQSLVSQHLRVLRGAGLVTPERRGREVAYRLVDNHVAHIVRDAITHADESGHSPAAGTTPALEESA